MAQTGDDCYFFYYSKCSKGASCPFRHQEAALGTEKVCALWKDGRCFRPVCSFRHMDIQKNRSHIPCYWEKQPGGCQKPHCVFLHGAAPRATPTVEAKKEPVMPVPDPLDWTTIKTIHPPPVTGSVQRLGQELISTTKDVPSPKVEQLVINPFEEESDQESINGTPQKLSKPEIRLGKIVALQKSNPAAKVISVKGSCIEEEADVQMISLVAEDSAQECNANIAEIQDNQNLGIKTLEEIQREKALQSLFRNRSMLKTVSGQSVHPVQQEAEVKIPLKRRIVLASGEGALAIPSNVSRKQNVGEKEEIPGEIGEALRDIKVTAPVGLGKISRNVKERLGLKTADTEVILEDKGKARIEDKNGKTNSSRKRKTSVPPDAEVSGYRTSGEKISKDNVLLTDIGSSKGIGESPSKIRKIEHPKITIKSLDEIRREKRSHRSQVEPANGDKKCVRKTRPSMEIYQPPVRMRAGVSGGNSNSSKKVTNENTEEDRASVECETNGSVERKITETKKTEAWLHVKSFAEIMKEKREKKLKEGAVISPAIESGSEAEGKEDSSGDIPKVPARASGVRRFGGSELKNVNASDCQSDVLKSKNDVILKKQVVANSSEDGNEILTSESTVRNCKRKFVPIVFDLGSRSESLKQQSCDPVSEPVVKQKKMSNHQTVTSRLNNPLSEKQDKLTSAAVNQGSSSLSSAVIKVSNVNRPGYSQSALTEVTSNVAADRSGSIVLDSSYVDRGFIPEKSGASVLNASTVKSRRLSQRLSSVGASQIKTKDVGRDIRNDDSLKLEDEEDDFSKQLDDLMVDIACIPDEEFTPLKDDSQDDDELLLEIQELLS